MEKALSYISVLPSTKNELMSFFEKMKDEVLNGDVNVLSVSEQVSAIKKLCEIYEKDAEIQEATLSEAEKYHKLELPKHITIRETGAKYHYSDCGHVVYNRLLGQKKGIEEKMKAIEQTLKSRDVIETDPETGETFEAHKAAVTSTTKVIFTLR